MNLSQAHEWGRAAEHLVVADLILQGIPAFLVSGSLPYDVIADFGGRRLRVQVKATHRAMPSGRADLFAFVVLETRAIAYLPVHEVETAAGTVKQCFDLRDSGRYTGRRYPGGKVRALSWHRMFEGHERFSLAASRISDICK